MTILVTGAAGYIGSHVVHELVDAGEEVVAFGHPRRGFTRLLPENVAFVQGDAGDADLLRLLLRDHAVDSIIHLAGSLGGSKSIKYPLAYYENNVTHSRTLIECAVEGGVRHFIFSSTAEVYGVPHTVPVSEDERAQPLSPYGWSKLMTEVMLRSTDRAHGLRSISLRSFNVAGADPLGRTGQVSAAATHLIKIACQAALGIRDHVNIYGADYPTPDRTCVRDFVHVADLARCYAAALGYLRRGGTSQVLNCGYGHGYSVREVIDVVQEMASHAFEVRIVDRRPGDPPILVADTTRLCQTVEWHPRLDDLRLIVRDALAWERTLISERSFF